MAQRAEETAVNEGKDIILVADYHAENIEFRWFNEATGEDRVGKYATTRAGILRQVEQAAQGLTPGGRIVWGSSSTLRTTWRSANIASPQGARGARHATCGCKRA
jgi:hypothetical protein